VWVFGEGGEVADVDEHHRDFTPFAGEDIVALLEKLRRQSRIDVGAERGVQASPLGQSGLHAVERGGQRTEIIILDHRQALAVVTGRHTHRAFGEVANGTQGRETIAGTVIGAPKPSVSANAIATEMEGFRPRFSKAPSIAPASA